MLLDHDWPGNVRELENYMARAVVLAAGGPLHSDLLAPPGRVDRPWRPLKTASGGGDLQSLIQQLVRLGVADPAGRRTRRAHRRRRRARTDRAGAAAVRPASQVKAAARLGINRNTLHKKVDDFRKDDQAGNGVEQG